MALAQSYSADPKPNGDVEEALVERMVVAQYRLRRIALPGIERTGFHLFARGVSVSHGYAHVVDCGEPVEVAGLRMNPGDMLPGDGAIAHSSTACYQTSNRRRALDKAGRSQAAGHGTSQKG